LPLWFSQPWVYCCGGFDFNFISLLLNPLRRVDVYEPLISTSFINIFKTLVFKSKTVLVLLDTKNLSPKVIDQLKVKVKEKGLDVEF